MNWNAIEHWGIQAGIAVAILVVGYIITKMVTRGVKKALARARVDATLSNFLSSMVRIILLAVIVMIALEQIGVETTSILAIFGAAGLAIGLALKDSLSNFAAGVMLLIFRPFSVGHFIEAGGTSGTVEAIHMFSTIMRSGDNKEITVPNAQIFSGTIVNCSTRPTRRVDLVMGCGYDDDLKKVRTALEEVVAADSRILQDPAPAIGVAELGASSVDFFVRSWVNTSDYAAVRSSLLEAFKLKFDDNGLNIPYPTSEVHSKITNG